MKRRFCVLCVAGLAASVSLLGPTSGLAQSPHGLTTDKTVRSSRPEPPPLETVLKQLFPEAQISVVPLVSSVVLHGTIDPQHMTTAIEIAEDYYPRVISHLQPPAKSATWPSSGSLLEQPAKSAAPPATTLRTVPIRPADTRTSESLAQEIQQLRAELRALRGEVLRLIDLIESPKGGAVPPAQPRQPGQASDNLPPSPAAANEIPLPAAEGQEVVELTLPEAVASALVHYSETGGFKAVVGRVDGSPRTVDLVASPERTVASLETEVKRHVGEVEEHFWRLWRADRTLATLRSARNKAQQLWSEVFENRKGGTSDGSEETRVREQFLHFQALVSAAQQDRSAREQELRAKLGLGPADGQWIRPADPWNLQDFKFQPDEALANALSRDPELAVQRNRVEDLELRAAEARGKLPTFYSVESSFANYHATGNFPRTSVDRQLLADVQNLNSELVRENARLAAMKLAVTHELSAAYKQWELATAQTGTNLQRASAARVAAASAEKLYRQGQETLDILLDAERRMAENDVEHYGALSLQALAIKDLCLKQGLLLENHHVKLIDFDEEIFPADVETTGLQPAAPLAGDQQK